MLNANDPLVVEMAAHCPGEVVFFAVEPNHPVIVRHRGVGGRAAFVRDRQLVLAEGDREEILLPLDRLPLTRDGQIAFQVENCPGVDRRRLVAGHSAGCDPRRGRIDRRRHRQGARPVQRAGDRGRHGGRRLRPQHALAGGRDRSPQHVPPPAPHVRLLDGRRPPRLRHRSPGRTAGRGLRSGDPLRGPLPPRPAGRRDRGPVAEGAGVGHPREGNRRGCTAPRRRPRRR